MSYLSHEDTVAQPPQVETKRRTPEVVKREIRKFALEQAVKIPTRRVESADYMVEAAAKFEAYILNGTNE